MTRDGTVGRSTQPRKPAASLGHASRSNDEASVRGMKRREFIVLLGGAAVRGRSWRRRRFLRERDTSAF